MASINDETYDIDSVILWLQEQKDVPAKMDRSEKAQVLRMANRAIDTRLSAIRTVMKVIPDKQARDIRKLITKTGWVIKLMHDHPGTKHLKDKTIDQQAKTCMKTCQAYMQWLAEDEELLDGAVDMNRVEKGLRAPLNEHARQKLADMMAEAEAEARRQEAGRRRRIDAQKEKEKAEEKKRNGERVLNLVGATNATPKGNGTPILEIESGLEELSLAELIVGINARMAIVQDRLQGMANIEAIVKRNEELEALFGLLREAAPAVPGPAHVSLSQPPRAAFADKH